MSSYLNDTQSAIVAALTSLSTLSGVVIGKAVAVEDAFALALTGKASVFVVYGGLYKAMPGPIGRGPGGNRTVVRDRWMLVCVNRNFANPTEGSTATNGTFELCEKVRGIRGTAIATSPNRYLTLISETPHEPAVRTERGGPTGIVCEYESQERFI